MVFGLKSCLCVPVLILSYLLIAMSHSAIMSVVSQNCYFESCFIQSNSLPFFWLLSWCFPLMNVSEWHQRYKWLDLKSVNWHVSHPTLLISALLKGSCLKNVKWLRLFPCRQCEHWLRDIFSTGAMAVSNSIAVIINKIKHQLAYPVYFLISNFKSLCIFIRQRSLIGGYNHDFHYWLSCHYLLAYSISCLKCFILSVM